MHKYALRTANDDGDNTDNSECNDVVVVSDDDDNAGNEKQWKPLYAYIVRSIRFDSIIVS